jgi:hypothetical protein
MNAPVKYIAQPRHVKEVSLLGSADLRFWQHRLLDENLKPAAFDGRAQILITAAEMKYLGIRVRELSFSILVCGPGHPTRANGAFLACAFNSSRFLAFCKRRLFSTPYASGEVGVSDCTPVSMDLIWKGERVFRAEMGTEGPEAREPERCRPDGWEGPVFLPEKQTSRFRQGKHFFAKLTGLTRTYPFLPTRDRVQIISSPACDTLQALIDSHFVSREWAIRPDATHARSRTFAGDPASRARG